MMTIPMLVLLDFSQPFMIETNAFEYDIDVVLMQRNQPIAYFSQASSQRARYKSIYERALMVVVLAMKKWHHYLLGQRFIIGTDQRSLKF